MGLENLFCWVPWLIKWVCGWFPRFSRLHVFQGGVKIGGNKVVELKPGFVIWIPHFSDVYVDNVKRKVVVLQDQLLTTKDGLRVRVGGLLVYHITNISTWLVENEDPDHGLLNEAGRVLREWVKAKSFAEIQDYAPSKRGEDELTRLAQSEMGTDFGVRVRQLSMTSFAETNATDLNHSGQVTTGSEAAPIMLALEE